ncbi:unnamed protein product [Ixodes hexagonus]
MSIFVLLVTVGLVLSANASSLRRPTCPAEVCPSSVDVTGTSCDLIVNDGKNCFCCGNDGKDGSGRTERAAAAGRRRFRACGLACPGGAVDTRNCRCVRRFG